MNTIETLRNALLVTALLLLIYVLYKRMLHIFRKQSIQTNYPELGNSMKWISDKHAYLEVKLERTSALTIEIFDAGGNLKLQLANQSFDPGVHSFELDASSFSAGRYYYKVISDKQQASQYFNIA